VGGVAGTSPSGGASHKPRRLENIDEPVAGILTFRKALQRRRQARQLAIHPSQPQVPHQAISARTAIRCGSSSYGWSLRQMIYWQIMLAWSVVRTAKYQKAVNLDSIRFNRDALVGYPPFRRSFAPVHSAALARYSTVNATLVIAGTSMACAGNSTICARRQGYHRLAPGG
jgi:hypothetical protein